MKLTSCFFIRWRLRALRSPKDWEHVAGVDLRQEGADNLDFALCVAAFPRRRYEDGKPPRYQRAEVQQYLDSILPSAEACYQRGGFLVVEIL